MTNLLTAGQVYALARGAGFTASEAVTMTVIAQYESGWNADNYNGNSATGDKSYGLWQINMLGNLGPERRKAFGITANEELFNPAVNARAARIIYKWQGYKAWSVYNHKTTHPTWNATRLKVEQAARRPGLDIPAIETDSGTPPSPTSPAVQPEGPEAGSSGGGIVGAIAGWVGKYVLLAVLFLAGGVLLLTGFATLPQVRSQIGGLAHA